MARREDVLGVTGADTVIGAGVIVSGNLNSEGDMVVDGEVSGNIKTLGNLTIGVNALINGNISGADVRVSGSLQGNINAEGEASIGETGNVLGDIICNTIAIGSGAVFRGRIQMQINPTLDLEEQGSYLHDQSRNRG